MMEDSLTGKGSEASVFESQKTLADIRASVRTAWRLVVAHKAEAASMGVLLLLGISLFVAISRKSITNDEAVHIPAGYYHLVAGNYQLNPEHPPLVKMWAAIPLLFIQPDEPQVTVRESQDFSQRSADAEQQFWYTNQKQFHSIAFWPRIMMIPVTIALGIVIFLFTRTMSNSIAALLAVLLYSIEPTVLAHGRVVHTDIPAALGYALFVFALFRYHGLPSRRNTIVLGVVTAVALLTKYSLIILVPLLVLYACAQAWTFRRNSGQLKTLLVHAALVIIIVVFIINSVYFFHHEQLNSADLDWLTSTSGTYSGVVMSAINALSYVIPEQYLFGVAKVALHNHYGHPAYLLGQYSNAGWRYYFPVAFALKTTLPFLIVSLLTMAWTTFQIITRRKIKLLWLFVPFLIYLAVSVSSSINIGIRHFLPAFPFLFMLVGIWLSEIMQSSRRNLGVALAVVIIGWMCVEAIRVFPNYTPYMNQLAVGPHWKYLSDSNIEWGDDVNSLAAYLRNRGETRVRAALSGGWFTLPLYGVDYVSLAPPAERDVDTRYVAIGASFLNGSTVPSFEVNGRLISDSERVNLFESYRHRTPEAVFGGEIYLFRER
jgi:4-amino-4-deoxy-L-arabinose transferase-like glycosyltransferase